MEFDIFQLFIVTWRVLGLEFATDFFGKERINKTKPFKNLLLEAYVAIFVETTSQFKGFINGAHDLNPDEAHY